MATVVIVDDEPMVCELYAIWLQQANYLVLKAGSVEQAQALLLANSADVLISDIRMTKATAGIDLLAWTKRRDPSLAVILVTGVPDIITAVEALRLNAYDYLVKPFPQADLLHTVDKAASHSQLLREKLRLEEENRLYQQHLEDLVARRTNSLERRTQQLMLLQRVTRTISNLREEISSTQQVTKALCDEFNYLAAAVLRVDRQRNLLIVEAVDGNRPGMMVPGGELPMAQAGIPGLAATREEPIVVQARGRWAQTVPSDAADSCPEAAIPVHVDGKVVYVLSVCQEGSRSFDQTDKVVLETLANHLGVVLSNTRLYAQLQDSLSIRDRVLQNVSHELRTPLTLVGGYAEFLLQTLGDQLPAEASTIAQTIFEQTQQLGHLVNQLVSFQRLQQEELHLDIIEVADWLQGVAQVWQPIAAKSGLTLQIDVMPNTGNAYGNWHYLNQMINNLLDNARKFSPEGGQVTIRGWREANRVQVAISDQGIGVSQDHLPLLFDRFYQAESGFTRQYGGMGMGLSVVREIVARHGGQIWAESDGIGKGLTITFTLQAVVAPPASL